MWEKEICFIQEARVCDDLSYRWKFITLHNLLCFCQKLSYLISIVCKACLWVYFIPFFIKSLFKTHKSPLFLKIHLHILQYFIYVDFMKCVHIFLSNRLLLSLFLSYDYDQILNCLNILQLIQRNKWTIRPYKINYELKKNSIFIFFF